MSKKHSPEKPGEVDEVLSDFYHAFVHALKVSGMEFSDLCKRIKVKEHTLLLQLYNGSIRMDTMAALVTVLDVGPFVTINPNPITKDAMTAIDIANNEWLLNRHSGFIFMDAPEIKEPSCYQQYEYIVIDKNSGISVA